MASKKALDEYREYTVLLEMLEVLHKHRDFLAGEPDHLKLHTNTHTIRTWVQHYRRMRQPTKNLSVTGKRQSVQNSIKANFAGLMGSRRIATYVGGKAHGVRELDRSRSHSTHSSYSYTFRLGWAWNRKVFYELYYNQVYHFQTNVILNAERVRVNNKDVALYEVTAFDLSTGTLKTAYVGKAKLGNAGSVLRDTVPAAVSGAVALMQDVMDATLLGEKK